jgi:hypothetical protein
MQMETREEFTLQEAGPSGKTASVKNDNSMSDRYTGVLVTMSTAKKFAQRRKRIPVFG